MDVRCERCQTEYEFDDALVSGRGTTVKCTTCGHKFKIRRVGGDFSEDFWHVVTAAGKTLVFTSLRELQRAIQSGLVERHDNISRGGLPAKPIGQIPELAPFFEQRGAPSDPTVRVPPAANRASQTPPPPDAAPLELAPPRARQSTRPDFPPPPQPPAGASLRRTLIGTGDGPHLRSRLSGRRPGSVPPEGELDPPTERNVRPSAAHEAAPMSDAVDTPARPQLSAQVARAAEESPRLALASDQGSQSEVRAAPPKAAEPEVLTPSEEPRLDRTAPILRVPAVPPASSMPKELPRPTPAPPSFEPSSPLPPPPREVARVMEEDVDTPRQPAVVPSESPRSLGARRRPVGGYIVAGVVVLCVGVLAAVWARQNLGATLGARSAAPVASVDPRVGELVSAGEKALAEGNLELAKESYDKASALAEGDARVMLGVARLAAHRADGAWLQSRLLSADAVDEQRATGLRLKELSEKANAAADAAMKVAPQDAGAVRAKIDALRISGDRDGARALVSRVAGSASQPETAYVLAALDLAEPEPLWSTVIERLRTAVSAEVGPGRARAALIYALARSGNVAEARVELERLSSLARPHVLLGPLRVFVANAVPSADAGAAGADDGGSAAAVASNGSSASSTGGAASASGGVRGDAKSLVAQGEAARARGDFDRARLLYSAALDKNPNDSEALAGLAAIAHAQHDLNGARASYRRVLQINPSYLPALVGAGDVEWESGNRAGAAKAYKDIVDRFPDGSYPARVKQRLESGQAGSSGSPAGSASASPSPSATGAEPAPTASPTAAPPTPAPEGGT